MDKSDHFVADGGARAVPYHSFLQLLTREAGAFQECHWRVCPDCCFVGELCCHFDFLKFVKRLALDPICEPRWSKWRRRPSGDDLANLDF